MIKSLKGFQDVLGRHQDREVQMAMLRSTADEVATLPGGAAACMAMGVLVDRLQVDERRGARGVRTSSRCWPPSSSGGWCGTRSEARAARDPRRPNRDK